MSGILGMIFLGIIPPDDHGLSITLAPYYYETEDTLQIPSSAVLHLDIDSTSQLLIDSTQQTFSSAELHVYDFLLERFFTKNKSYLWIRVHRRSEYTYYIQLRDAIKRAEKRLLNELTIRFFGESFDGDLPLDRLERLQSEISICIIEEDEAGKPYLEASPFCDC